MNPARFTPLYNDDTPEGFFGGLGHVTVSSVPGDYFHVAAPSPAIAQPFTWGAVWRSSSAGNVFREESSPYRFLGTASGVWGIGDLVEFVVLTGGTGTLALRHLLGVNNGVSSKLYENGGLSASGDSGSSGVSSIFRLAQVNGRFAEAWVIEGAISDADRTELDGYVASKYGL